MKPNRNVNWIDDIGYPTDLFVTMPAEDFICQICLDVFEDPYQCLLGHSFCCGCIMPNASLSLETHCPMCKSILARRCDFRKNENLQQRVSELQVKCNCNPMQCCGWIGPLRALSEHLKTCSLVEEDCLFFPYDHCAETCTGKVVRKDLQHHYSQAGIINRLQEQDKQIQTLQKHLFEQHVSVLKAQSQLNHTSLNKTSTDENKHSEHMDSLWKDSFHGTITTQWGIYVGDCVKNCKGQNIKHGEGSVTQHNGGTFTCTFIHDLEHGIGTLQMINGDRFVARYAHGVLDREECRWERQRKGEVYTGSVNNSLKPHGYGVLTRANGDCYEGWFVKGKKHGDGSYSMKSTGRVLDGVWMKNKYMGLCENIQPGSKSTTGNGGGRKSGCIVC